MINLAKEDIKYTFTKFVATSLGVGMLIGVVLIMIGVYRGMMIDGQILVNDINASLWVVQENTLGPFAESSRVHEDMKDIIKAVPGIDKSEALTFQVMQLPLKNHKKMLVNVVGYDPLGQIIPINKKRLIKGSLLKDEHYTIVVSDKTGYKLNDKIKLKRHFYKVVGITHGTVSAGGNPLLYVSLKDAQELQFSYSNKEIQNDRARGIKRRNLHIANAIVATVKPGFNRERVAKDIQKWQHKSVYTDEKERTILLRNVINMARKQIGMFTFILIIASTVIVALVIYTMTLEKIKEISIMKLIGVPNRVIINMILEETLTLGSLAFIFANIFAHSIYGKFPKRVVLEIPDAFMLFAIIILASVVASFVGIKKVIEVNPQEAIGG